MKTTILTPLDRLKASRKPKMSRNKTYNLLPVNRQCRITFLSEKLGRKHNKWKVWHHIFWAILKDDLEGHDAKRRSKISCAWELGLSEVGYQSFIDFCDKNNIQDYRNIELNVLNQWNKNVVFWLQDSASMKKSEVDTIRV